MTLRRLLLTGNRTNTFRGLLDGQMVENVGECKVFVLVKLRRLQMGKER